MRLYFLRRLLLMIATLFGITLVTFAVIQLAPGSPVEQKLQQIRFAKGKGSLGGAAQANAMVDPSTVEALKKQYGFDKPLHERYLNWLKNLARFDFGKSSVYGSSALSVIVERFPVSLQFGAASFLLTYVVSISLGLLMAVHENRSFDVATSFLLIALAAVPPFMLGILLLVFFAGGTFLDVFPVGYLHSDNYDSLPLGAAILDRIHHFILPLICYLVGSFTSLALLGRNSVLEEVRKDYIRTARAKGVREAVIYGRHALRNALIPLTTGIGGMLAIFLSGSVLVESVFQLQGIGQLGYLSVMSRDYNVIMALIFLSSLALLLGNLLGDVIYALVDPRVDFQ
jgi:microcin C transport system permease protein